MPFLILPRSLPLTEQQLEALGARLCPYGETPCRTELPEGMDLWSTSLVVIEGQSARAKFGSGTADFQLDWDHDTLDIRTDPLGTCPIWFSTSPQGKLISPEAKAIGALLPVELVSEDELKSLAPRPIGWSPYRNVERLPPGKTMCLNGGDLTVEGDCVSFAKERAELGQDEDWPARLGEQLMHSFRPPASDTGAFVSGGIDSSLACAFARTHVPTHAYSLGTSYGDE
ncbi:MAG: asparagine synthase-related protein, partial [Planctomycetota bacterium]